MLTNKQSIPVAFRNLVTNGMVLCMTLVFSAYYAYNILCNVYILNASKSSQIKYIHHSNIIDKNVTVNTFFINRNDQKSSMFPTVIMIKSNGTTLVLLKISTKKNYIKGTIIDENIS